MLNRFLLSTILFILSILSISSSEWNYQSQANWIINSGDHQSPINIITKNVTMNKDLGPYVFHYKNIINSVEDTGHAVQASLSGSAMINNRPFKIAQVHFHTPSEHIVDGKSYPMEAHFVHFADDGRIAVVAVFLNTGEENPFFQNIINNFKEHEKNIINLNTSVEEFFPKNLSYYHYLGSLTTPPLEENVEWYILAVPVTISIDQLEQMKHFYNNNTHTIQPLRGRSVLMKTMNTGINY